METGDIKRQFVEIYEKEADSVFRYVLLRVADREEVIDIVQDTFARFWQSLNDGSRVKHPKSFIFAIARNRVIDWYRRKKPRSLEATLEGEDGIFFEIQDENMHQSMKISAEAAIVLRALSEISFQNQEAVYLRFVEDLPPAEISKVLGITPNAASIRINRGLEELRKILKISLDNDNK